MKELKFLWVSVVVTGWLCVLLPVPVRADLSAVISPGYVYAAGERPTVSTLNRLGNPSIQIVGTIGGTNANIAAKSVTGAMLADGVAGTNALAWDGASPRGLKVSTKGILTSMLDDAAVTAAKLAASSVYASNVVSLPASVLPYVAQTNVSTASYVTWQTKYTVLDDTIPQLTEGSNILTLAYQPAVATSVIKVTAEVHCATDASSSMITLHTNDAVNAVCAVARVAAANTLDILRLQYVFKPGVTNSITYKVQVGCPATGTMHVNGNASGRLLGGVMVSRLTVEEVKE